MRFVTPVEHRLWPCIAICEHGRACRDCCWPWTGTLTRNGLPMILVKRKDTWRNVSASRLVWEMEHKEILPAHLMALHTCRNVTCCNPSHLMQGTKQDWALHIKDQDWTKRFWQHVRICLHGIECPYCCWEWQGPRHSWGYGIFNLKVDGQWKHLRASRVIWEIWHGHPLPEPLWALHHCDNPCCCNIMHLYPGTPAMNTRDMCIRGRASTTHVQRGESHGRAKLAAVDIPDIWKLHAQGLSAEAIAQRIGKSSTSSIKHVLHLRSWGHISRPLIAGES